MEKRILKFKYVYTFYSLDEEMGGDVRVEEFEVFAGCRFKLAEQENSTFLITSVGADNVGEYVVLTYPNKDNMVIHLGEVSEFVYGETYEAMGDVCHNIYEGTVELA